MREIWSPTTAKSSVAADEKNLPSTLSAPGWRTRRHTDCMRAALIAAPARIADSATRPVGDRVRGIDVARGVAILGMVMVHIGPVRAEGFGSLGAAYRLPHGRAAILFVVVAGIGISLLAGDRTRERLRGTVARLGWRALILLPAGLALTTLPHPVAVILHYYAFYFLVAVVALWLSDRMLLWLAGAFAVFGPVLLLVARQEQPEWFAPGMPSWNEGGHIARDLVVSGTYPAVVWVVPLFVGMWVGRQDLRSARVAALLLVAGSSLAALSFAAHDLLPQWIGTPSAKTDWSQLAALEPHNGMPLWVLSATGIALALVGLCVLLARALPRIVWPAVAVGQLALTIYVAHLLVLSAWPEWLVRESFESAFWSVGRFALVALVIATVWRALASRGPLEALLHAPWWLARKLRGRDAGKSIEPPPPAQVPGVVEDQPRRVSPALDSCPG